MIDKLVLRCHFSQPENFDLQALRIPLSGSIDSDGQVYDLKHMWESIPSSFSTLAFKVFDYNDKRTNPDPFIEIKASPAKLSQGHNVYGSDDLGECAIVLLELLVDTYPQVVELLDWSTWDLAECDITYASWADSPQQARQFINALCNISNGHTKARTGYDGTAYFGKKDSRLKKIKVYDKLNEVTQYLKKRQGSKDDPSRFYTEELLGWCEGMIRWEVTLKTRWFERRNIPTNLVALKKVFNPVAYWMDATQDLFKALEGESMKIFNDEEVQKLLQKHFPTVNQKTGKITFGQANAAYRTYRAIKQDGYTEVKKMSSERTFNRHIEMITACGMSKAHLQNMLGDGYMCEVIPMVRYAKVEFRNQYPEFLKAA